MQFVNSVHKQVNAIVKISLLVGVLSSVASAQQQNPSDYEDLIIIENSVVVADKNNQINLDEGISAIGDYKYSLDGSLVISQAQNVQSSTVMKVVKNPSTGRIGLTNGLLIIKYADGENGSDLALNYGLSVIDELPSLNRVVAQLKNPEDFTRINEAMKLDNRVISTELEIYYGPPVHR